MATMLKFTYYAVPEMLFATTTKGCISRVVFPLETANLIWLYRIA